MENGIRKDWTPQREEVYAHLVASSNTFAERQIIMNIRDLMKYDQRTNAGKRANAQARLRLATCSDDELKELAEIEITLLKLPDAVEIVENKLEKLKQMRADIREKGIKRGELGCR